MLDGDAGAFESLMHRHFSGAWAVAISIMSDADEAEDVCQDSFVRAWDRRHQCRDHAKFRAWLMTITRSVAYNRLESLRRRRQEPLSTDAPEPGRSPEAAVEIADLRDKLQRGLATLTDAQREVLVLRDLEGWRHDEIAEHLDISETMSRRHLSDARKSMRVYLGQTELK